MKQQNDSRSEPNPARPLFTVTTFIHELPGRQRNRFLADVDGCRSPAVRYHTLILAVGEGIKKKKIKKMGAIFSSLQKHSQVSDTSDLGEPIAPWPSCLPKTR